MGLELSGVRNGHVVNNRFVSIEAGYPRLWLEGNGDVEVRGNTFMAGSPGPLLDGATGYALRDNTLNGSASITVRGSGWNLLERNLLEAKDPAGPGIDVSDSRDLEIRSNRIANGSAEYYGVAIHRSKNLRITDNVFEDNARGLALVHSADTVIAGNRFAGETNVGLDLAGSNGNVIRTNTFSGGGGTGLRLSNAGQNLIYDNSFGTPLDVLEAHGNVWNVTKTLGPNVIGGPFLGGNYWHDYVGVDGDGDGLGEVPYGVLPDGSLGPVEPLQRTVGIPGDVSDLAKRAVHYGIYDEHPLMRGRVQVQGLDA